jgi:hypothetical protein
MESGESMVQVIFGPGFLVTGKDQFEIQYLSRTLITGGGTSVLPWRVPKLFTIF